MKYILSYPILMNDLFQAITDSTKFQLNPSINKVGWRTNFGNSLIFHPSIILITCWCYSNFLHINAHSGFINLQFTQSQNLKFCYVSV